MFFSSIPRKLYTIFQPTFFPIKCYQDSLFKLLTLSTNSVTKKKLIVRHLKFCDSVCTQSKKLYEAILEALDRENVGWKMVYNFLGKDEKHGEISNYFCLKHRCRKKSGHFSVQCIQAKTM